MTPADLTDLEERLPVMPDEERVILVETWNTWEGVMETGLGQQTLENFIFTRPRFAPQVIFEGSSPPGGHSAGSASCHGSGAGCSTWSR